MAGATNVALALPDELRDVEEWLPLREGEPWDSRYEVSSHGRVRHIRTGRILAQARDLSRNSKVYLRVSLWAGHGSRAHRTRKWFMVHRLVAASFFGPAETSTEQVDHIDGVSTNNHVTNLRWVEPKVNASTRGGKFAGPDHPSRRSS